MLTKKKPWAFRKHPTRKQCFMPSYPGIHFSRKSLRLSWPVLACLPLSWPVLHCLTFSWPDLASLGSIFCPNLPPTWHPKKTKLKCLPIQTSFLDRFLSDFYYQLKVNYLLPKSSFSVDYTRCVLDFSLFRAYVCKKIELTQVHSAKPPQPSGLVRCLM